MVVSIGWWTKPLHQNWLEINMSIHPLKEWLFRVPGGSCNHWTAESAFLVSWSYLSPFMSTALLQNGVTSFSDFNCRIHHLFWKPTWNPTEPSKFYALNLPSHMRHLKERNALKPKQKKKNKYSKAANGLKFLGDKKVFVDLSIFVTPPPMSSHSPNHQKSSLQRTQQLAP